jgi:hypothetical protein
MAEYDTAALVEDVKERGSLPANDARFTTAKVLSACTLELREGVAPLLVTARSEHLVYDYTVAVANGTASYRMPPRAVGGALRNVSFIDTSGNPVRLREISLDEVEQIGATTNGGTPYAYYVRGYRVVLVPVPNVVGTLTMPYYARPNALSETNTSRGGPAQSVSLFNGNVDVRIVVSLGSISNGTAFAAAATGKPLDVIDRRPPFEALVFDATPDSVVDNGNGTVRVQYPVSTFVSLPVAGDYVYLAGYSPVPQVPAELQGLLAARAARRLVKAVGDDRWQALDADVAELEQRAKDWLAPRVSGQTQQAGGTIGSSGIGPFGGNWWGW